MASELAYKKKQEHHHHSDEEEEEEEDHCCHKVNRMPFKIIEEIKKV